MIKRALIVKDPYATEIVKGEKPEEYRNARTTFRERIGIIKAGTKTIIGEVDLVDCQETWDGYAWVLENPIQYKIPKPYKHPPGAQIWVKLR